MSALEFLKWFWPVFAAVAFIVTVYYFVLVRPLMRENKAKKWYASEAALRVITQDSPMDLDFWARYERECARFRDSGNKASLIQVPVLPYPFDTAFEFEFFGERYRRSTIGMDYNEYRLKSYLFLCEFKAKWEQKVYEDFDMKTLMQDFKKQRPLDEKDIWSEYQKRGAEKAS